MSCPPSLKPHYKVRYYLAAMTKKAQQVVPNLRDGWSVKSIDSLRAIKTLKTQAEAVVWARAKSKRNGLGLIVHGRDGMVRYRHYM